MLILNFFKDILFYLNLYKKSGKILFLGLDNSGKKTLNDLVNSTLSKTASDVYEQSDSSIPLENFQKGETIFFSL